MKTFRLSILCFFMFFFGLMALSANSAQAHRLNVFAWLENNEIIVECNYGNNRPASDARVIILDKNTGQTLTQGTTDKSGHFNFPVPGVVREGHTLAIDVNAGDGHKSEWVMPASEFYAAESLSEGFEREAAEASRQRGQTPPSSRQAGQADEAPARAQGAPALPPATRQRPGSQIGPEHLRIMIRDEMEQQLAPIRRALAASSSDGPKIGEIVGGLGWIVGLVGIVLFFLGRRKKQA